jgi:hypothetical protein
MRAAPFLAFLAAASAAPPAAAEVFQLRDGETVEGEVLRTFRDDGGSPDRWEVRTRKGTRVLEAAAVRSLKEGGGPWPWRIFEQRLTIVDPADAEDNYALGAWALAEGLEAEAVRAFRRAVAADPTHARARIALGFRKVGDAWVPAADRRTHPEDRGEPVAAAEPDPLEARLGRRLARRRSESFEVASTVLDQRALGRALDALERTREATLALLGEAPPAGERPRARFLLVADAAEFRAAVDLLVAPSLAARPDRDAAAREIALYRGARMAPLPDGGACLQRGAAGDETEDRSRMCHFAVHGVAAAGEAAAARTPAWLREATAYAVLHDLFPDDPTWCVETGYGRSDRVPSAWRNTRTWRGAARAMAASGKALAFRDLAGLDLNGLSFDALIQSWSVLAALRAKDEAGTRNFLQRVRGGADPSKALADALKMDPDGVDACWKAEVLRGK